MKLQLCICLSDARGRGFERDSTKHVVKINEINTRHTACQLALLDLKLTKLTLPALLWYTLNIDSC